MINLDQVRTLEWKVKQAVQLIVHLRRENDTLRGRLSDTEVRLQELEALLESFKASQNELESGIRSALEELDHLEDGPAPASEPADPVSYPPVTEAAPEQTFVSDEPAALFERSPSFASADPGQKAAVERSFEEEFEALAAEEEAKVVEAAVPESVELEAEAEVDAPEAPPAEEKRPDQPGLGIF
jgi:chromosome segregation ATPase